MSTSVELDGREGLELLSMVSDARQTEHGTEGGATRAWLVRCGDADLEVLATARWTYVGPGTFARSPWPIHAVSGTLNAGDPFRPLIVSVSSSSGTVAWRRSHVYVLDGGTLREVLTCLTYFDGDTTTDPEPDFDGTIRSLPDGRPGFEIERRYERSYLPQGSRWRRHGYDWDGTGLVARTPDDFCRDDDPAPPDAPME
jgi:hypothetical protein